MVHPHIGRTALELRAGMLAETRLADDLTARDLGVVAAHEINRLPAPTRDAAIENPQPIDTGTFDAVEISVRSNVLNLEVREGHIDGSECHELRRRRD